jgi:hypothetical protein
MNSVREGSNRAARYVGAPVTLFMEFAVSTAERPATAAFSRALHFLPKSSLLPRGYWLTGIRATVAPQMARINVELHKTL